MEPLGFEELATYTTALAPQQQQYSYVTFHGNYYVYMST